MAKEPIKLRKRKTSNGEESLYLDIYYNGNRSYEYLKLYLVPEKTRIDKQKNKQTLELAESIRADRLSDLYNNVHGRTNRKDMLFDVYEKVMNSKANESTRMIYRCSFLLLKKFSNDILINDVTSRFINDFRIFIQNTNLSANTKFLYFSKFAAVINSAYNNDIIQTNFKGKYKIGHIEDTNRIYLTKEEIHSLYNTDCKYDIKKAFLFSCITGLRFIDIFNLKWRDVYEAGGRIKIMFRQQKTKGVEYLDINNQALLLMGNRLDDDKRVFGIKYILLTKRLREWASNAGIHKNITFHSARHTFAMLMIEADTDIYTISKLLGHKNITTTQIYAKMLDKRKQDAVDRLPHLLDFGENN